MDFLEAAKKFGVKVEPTVEPNEYIAAYLTELLLQREKLDLGVLDSYLRPGVKEAWKELLSHLEQTKRKVLAVTEGSLSFTFFCPTVESYEQLQNETWRKQLVDKLTHLLKVIGKFFFFFQISMIFLKRLLITLNNLMVNPHFMRGNGSNRTQFFGYCKSFLPKTPHQRSALPHQHEILDLPLYCETKFFFFF